MFCWHNVLSSKGKSFNKILPGGARIGGVIGGMIGQTSRTTTMHEPTWTDACQTGAWLPSCTQYKLFLIKIPNTEPHTILRLCSGRSRTDRRGQFDQLVSNMSGAGSGENNFRPERSQRRS